MTRQEITDEMLVAFADGEADEATAELVMRALDEDEGLAARLDGFMESRQILKAQFEPVGREPVPEHLLRLVMAGGGADAAAEPAARPVSEAPRRRVLLPMAAALAGVVAGGLGYWALAGRQAPAGGEIASFAAAQPELVRALDEAGDGGRQGWRAGERGGEIEIGQSYRTRDGFCRSFALGDAVLARGWSGVACREADGWHVRVAAAAQPQGGAFTPASGAAVIDGYLDAAEAGAPLAENEVREQIAKGWR
jgi:hypothetical protein